MAVKKHRGIDVNFWTDEKIVALSPLARLLFIGSWHYCCDQGHLGSTPVELKMRVLPADNCNVYDLFEEIVAQGLYVRHEDGSVTVPKLPEHQRLDKRWLLSCDRCETTGGPPEDHEGATGGAREDHERSTRGPRDERKGKEMKGEEGGARTRRKAATPAPDSLDLSEDDLAWAREKAPLVNLEEATEEFLTWARSVDKRYADWKAAWRNAMKRQQGFAVRDGRHLRPVPHQQQPTDASGRAADWMLA